MSKDNFDKKEFWGRDENKKLIRISEKTNETNEPAPAQKVKQNHRGAIHVILVCAIVAIAIGLIVGTIMASFNNQTKSNEQSKSKVIATSLPESTPNPFFKQVPDDNAGKKVYAKFSEKFAKALAETKSVSKAAKSTLLKNSANNAHRLAIWGNAMGLYDNPNDFQRLLTEKGDYLSKEGIALFYKMKKALNAEGTELGITNAPANGFNSYVNGKGDFVISESKGITGNRKAIVIIFREGKNGKIILKVKIMIRCGNTVYEKWIVILSKPKPTPTPRPTPVRTPGPTPIVTPQPTPTLAPKGDHWYYTSPKPTAQPIATTDVIPPKVATPAPCPPPIVAPNATPSPTHRPILPTEKPIMPTSKPQGTPPPNKDDPGNPL